MRRTLPGMCSRPRFAVGPKVAPHDQPRHSATTRQSKCMDVLRRRGRIVPPLSSFGPATAPDLTDLRIFSDFSDDRRGAHPASPADAFSAPGWHSIRPKRPLGVCCHFPNDQSIDGLGSSNSVFSKYSLNDFGDCSNSDGANVYKVTISFCVSEGSMS